MPFNKMWLALCVLMLIAHAQGARRRWRQPLLRGPAWFFDVKVQPGFYSGAGKKILDRYRMRMLMPLAILALCLSAVIGAGYFGWLTWICLGTAILIHVNHAFSVDKAEKEARKFAVPEAEQPVAQVQLSLKTRRLRDYSNAKFEAALALSSVVCAMALAAVVYLKGYTPKEATLGCWLGIYFLYVHLGLLYVKSIIVAWRTPAPQQNAEEHLKVREERRKFYLQSVDWCRAVVAAQFLFAPVIIRMPRASLPTVISLWLSGLLAVSVAQMIWTERKRKKIREMTARLEPQKLPDFSGQQEQKGWLLCYQPSVPTLVMKGPHGYALNLAHGLTQLGAAYLAGYVVLVVAPRFMGH